jgi:hypothetical protein
MTDGARDRFYDAGAMSDERGWRRDTMIASTSADQIAFDGFAPAAGAHRVLTDLSDDLTRALDQALWSFDLRGDLDEALDGALLRSVLAETPTFSGGQLSAGVA